MALASQLLSRDPKLQACLVSDLAHIVEGAAGEHVSKTLKRRFRFWALQSTDANSGRNGTALRLLRPC